MPLGAICRLLKLSLISVIVLFVSFPSLAQQDLPVIGVLGLKNKGGVSQSTIDTICNRVSGIIEGSRKYYVLNREFIPMVLDDGGFTISENGYTQEGELSAAGKLLSVQ